MTVETGERQDQCPTCERYALIVEQVTEDLQCWVIVCAVCGTAFETGELHR